jgi:hypothetical protein
MTRAKATTKTTTFLTKKKAKCEKLWTLPGSPPPRPFIQCRFLGTPTTLGAFPMQRFSRHRC